MLNEESAEAIWDQANEALQQPQLSTWGILDKFKVEAIGTTDDPTDTLDHHAALGKSECPARVVPTFRPDNALKVEIPQNWNAWVDKLEQASGQNCSTLNEFLDALASNRTRRKGLPVLCSPNWPKFITKKAGLCSFTWAQYAT